MINTPHWPSLVVVAIHLAPWGWNANVYSADELEHGDPENMPVLDAIGFVTDGIDSLVAAMGALEIVLSFEEYAIREPWFVEEHSPIGPHALAPFLRASAS